jgi:enamine deaminase RidA (YjgF/YER057c/UK114 family)
MARNVILFLFFLVTQAGWSQDVYQKIKEANITLTAPGKPVANYVKSVRSGNLIFLAGHGPAKPDGSYVLGKVGRDLTTAQGADAAKLTAISLLSTLHAEIGDLNKVKRVVKVLGMVNCTEQFTEQPQVMNGFSDVMVFIFGEKGKHARSAVGMHALPLGFAVEIEMIVEVED